MSVIKNVHKLEGLLAPPELEKLEAGAALHLRHSNISFKIINVFGNELHVRAEQGKSAAENYATTQALVTRARELFGPFFPGRTIHSHPVPYAPAPVDVVTPEWLQREMRAYGIKIKDFERLTGIDKTNLSAWVNGLRPMSQIVRAMFYYVIMALRRGEN